MILDQYPTLLQLDAEAQMQLSAELWDVAVSFDAKLTPEVLDALEERVAFDKAHPEEALTPAQVAARLAEAKRAIDHRLGRG